MMQCSQARWRGVERGAPRWRTFASSPLHLFTIETIEARESEMSEFWVPSMQQECERIVRPEKGKGLGRRRTGPAIERKRGQVWLCCVSCTGVAVS
jgi:hypothetical protein